MNIGGDGFIFREYQNNGKSMALGIIFIKFYIVSLFPHIPAFPLIYTTAEIVIGATEEFRFLRTFDEQTGYQELEIEF
jgi:hypothetical protein